MSKINVVFKETNKILIVILIIIAILVFSVSSFLFISYKTQTLSSFINSTGVIRGGIQRYTKLYLLNDKGIKTESDKIDSQLKKLTFYIEKNRNFFSTAEIKKYGELLDSWSYYHININSLTKEELLLRSENIWNLSHEVVNIIEIKTRRCISYIYFVNMIILISIILLVLILLSIKMIVQNRIEKEAAYDKLTGLYNRNYMVQLFLTKKEESEKSIMHLAILMCDIDHFKQINDTFGHDIGDKVLKNIASILKEKTRDSDVIIRYGGEEFVLFTTFKEKRDVLLFAERLRLSVEQSVIIEKNVTISIGVSLYESKNDLSKTLLQVDTALYKAKEQGRNRVIIDDLISNLHEGI